MLPDWPKIKSEVINRLTLYARSKAKSASIVSLFREQRHFEGDLSSSLDKNGRLKERSYSLFKSVYKVNKDDLINRGLEVCKESADHAIAELTMKQDKVIIDKLIKTASESGVAIDFQGKPFTFDSYLELLKIHPLEFNDDGKAQIPSLLCSPEDADKLNKIISDALNSPTERAKLDRLLECKRKEWNDRESNRKLVD